jgi:alkyl sulfatase BDS1-like metallo-beta-lactamase superfamily hydrolase
MNVVTPDNGERFVVELSNGTLTSLQGFLADSPDVTLTLDRTDLEDAMTGARPLQQQVADGTATLEGDASVLHTLAGALSPFEPTFAIMPGSSPGTVAVPADAFAHRDLADSSGG